MAILLAPLTLLRRNEVRLFLTSFAILFVELLLIRWIPSNVKYIGFFSNFLLIASFLGIGLGILIGRKGFNPRVSPFAVLLAAVVLYVFTFQLNVQIKSDSEIFFGLAESTAVDQNFLILPLIVALIVALLATLALPLGPLLKSMPPLKAYAIDITGSLAGIASFTILSALGTDPVVWFTVGVLIVLGLELGRRLSLFTVVNVVALGAVLVLVFQQGQAHSNDIWSPYYRINEYPDSRGVIQLSVDGIPHQALHPVGQPGLEPFYDQVYNWFPGRTYQNVLIVGAGSGSDVAIAEIEGRGPHRRRRDRPEAAPDRRAAAPQSALQRPARYALRERRPCLPAHDRQQVRPDRLRSARLLDTRQSAVIGPARIVPVHDPGLPGRARSPGSGRRFRPLQLLPRPLARDQALEHAPDIVWHGAAAAHLQQRRGGDGRRSPRGLTAQRSAARRSRRPGAGRWRPHSTAGDRRLAVPVPAHALHRGLLPVRAGNRAASARSSRSRQRPDLRARPSASSARTSLCWAWRSCCSTRAA